MQLNSVCVLGAGTMGQGIAQWFAQTGARVELSDINIEACENAKSKMFASWDKLADKGKFTKEQINIFKENITLCEDVSQYSKKADLFIEAIVEDLNIKVQLLQKLDKHFNASTILASNTSSIPIDAMARELTHERKKRFIGLHFFNPAPIMKLVEIIKGHWSDAELCESLSTYFSENGKKPAQCIDGPGFIVNRLARNFYGEALRIVGHEDTQAIIEFDNVMREVGGFRMGPFELMDLIGIDVNYKVTQSVWESFYYQERFAPHALQRKMVTSGRLGRKTKAGFYDYE